MSKVLVKLHRGSLLDLLGGNQYILSYRPMVVTSTSLVQATIARGQMDLLGKLKDEAKDADFAKCWDKAKGDSEKAVVEYLKSWDVKKKSYTNVQNNASNGNTSANNTSINAGNSGTENNS